jgi:hypothetical protein
MVFLPRGSLEEFNHGRLGIISNHAVGILQQLHKLRNVASEGEAMFLVRLHRNNSRQFTRMSETALQQKKDLYPPSGHCRTQGRVRLTCKSHCIPPSFDLGFLPPSAELRTKRSVSAGAAR